MGRATAWWAAVVFAACGLPACHAAKSAARKAGHQAVQWVALPLDVLGFPGVSDTFLRSGSSMLTVHFVDNTHLLVTYSLRALVPRLEGDPGSDDDRLVAAEVVDLPSGKVAARTVWHMHDHGRYLWSLGHGRFLVRIAGRLYSMDPGARLGLEDPFRRILLADQKYPATAVFVSPDDALVTVESVVSYVNPDGRAAALLGDTNADKPVERTMIQFFRVAEPGTKGEPKTDVRTEPELQAKPEAKAEPQFQSQSAPESEAQARAEPESEAKEPRAKAVGTKEPTGPEASLRIAAAGVVMSTQPVILPLDSDGYLSAEPAGRNLWAVSFDEFGGKTVEVTKLESTCHPRPQMVSRSEFVAFLCHGAADSVRIVSYGLDGRETWEEGLGDIGTPAFAFAPAAARFALSHTSSVSGPPSGTLVQADPLPRQEVRVYQNASGELLLRTECSPSFKIPENFDLSADGMLAAIVRNGAIAVYKLPPLEKVDREDMEDVAKFAPPLNLGPVNLDALVRRAAASENAEGGTGAPRPGPSQAIAGGALTGGSAAGVAPHAPAGADGAPTVLAGQPAGVGTAVLPSGSVAAMAAAPARTGRRPPTLLKPGEKPEFGSANTEQTDQSGAGAPAEPVDQPN